MEIIKEGEDKVLPSSAQLPFSLSEAVKIGEGSTSIVYKVAVRPGHLQYKYLNIRNPDPQLIAVKQFNNDSIDEFREEKKVLSKIRASNKYNRIILSSYGSLVLGEEKSPDAVRMILLPLTDRDNLDVFMQNREHRNTPAKRSNCISCMIDVAEALESLTKVTLPSSQRLQDTRIIHCDLKPENILVVTEDEGFVFKLSDFGLSVLSSSKKKRKPIYNSTYCAPEIAQERGVQHNSDVWSYGCILLLVLIFTTRGPGEIALLRKKLESNDSNRDNGYDTFHERVPGSSKYSLKQPVLDWINNFKNGELSDPDITVTEMKKTVGKILQDDILVPDYTKRKKIDVIQDRLRTAYNALHTTVQTVSFSDQRKGLVDFEQCVVPVKAEYVCFNCKKTNSFGVFFTDALLSNGQLDFMQPMAPQSGNFWEERFSSAVSTYASSQICLVEKTQQNHMICLFQLERDQNACTEFESLEITWATGQTLLKIAVSADGHWIATCTRSKKNDKHSIQIISTEGMRRLQPQPQAEDPPRTSEEATLSFPGRSRPSSRSGQSQSGQSQSGQSHSGQSHSGQSHSGQSRPEGLLEQRVSQVRTMREICFTRNSHNLVVVAYVYHKDLKPAAKVLYFQYKDLQWIFQEEWTFVSDDSSNEFWTSTVPFNCTPGFLAITHKKRLIRSGESGTESRIKRFPCKIDTVLLTKDDKFGIVISVESGLRIFVVSTTDIDNSTEIPFSAKSEDTIKKSYKGYSAGLYDEEGRLILFLGLPAEQSISRLDITEAVQRFKMQ